MTTRKSGDRYWTTEREIEFIDGMGASGKIPRRTLIEGYLAGMEKRKVWNSIDREWIRAHCEMLLA